MEYFQGYESEHWHGYQGMVMATRVIIPLVTTRVGITMVTNVSICLVTRVIIVRFTRVNTVMVTSVLP